tara:strand:- start:363 stop:605 length:243 start_codon:yes stop_codon:yes gene_type:complete
MEHLEVTDFIHSHFDESGNLLSRKALYDVSCYRREVGETYLPPRGQLRLTVDDILEAVEEIYGSNLVDHAIEVIESIDAS